MTIPFMNNEGILQYFLPTLGVPICLNLTTFPTTDDNQTTQFCFFFLDPPMIMNFSATCLRFPSIYITNVSITIIFTKLLKLLLHTHISWWLI